MAGSSSGGHRVPLSDPGVSRLMRILHIDDELNFKQSPNGLDASSSESWYADGRSENKISSLSGKKVKVSVVDNYLVMDYLIIVLLN